MFSKLLVCVRVHMHVCVFGDLGGKTGSVSWIVTVNSPGVTTFQLTRKRNLSPLEDV